MMWRIAFDILFGSIFIVNAYCMIKSLPLLFDLSSVVRIKKYNLHRISKRRLRIAYENTSDEQLKKKIAQLLFYMSLSSKVTWYGTGVAILILIFHK